MTEQTQWLRLRARFGWLLLAGGLVLLAGSLIAARVNPNETFDFRIVGGLGILVAGIGLAFAVRYGMALRDTPTARRVMVEERDERTVFIRQRAGSRAYWISAAAVFGGLMWSSFAANGQLPPLEGDALWNYLAAATIVPLAVYLGSVILDERMS